MGSPHEFEPIAVAERVNGEWTALLRDVCIWCGQPEAPHLEETTTMHASCTLSHGACDTYNESGFRHCATPDCGHPRECHAVR